MPKELWRAALIGMLGSLDSVVSAWLLIALVAKVRVCDSRFFVMPAKGGIQGQHRGMCPWTPAFEAVIQFRISYLCALCLSFPRKAEIQGRTDCSCQGQACMGLFPSSSFFFLISRSRQPSAER